MKSWKCVTPAATDAPQAALIAGRRNGSPRLSGQVSVSASHNGNKGSHLVLRHFGLFVTIQYATTLFHVDTHNALTGAGFRFFDTNFQIDYD